MECRGSIPRHFTTALGCVPRKGVTPPARCVSDTACSTTLYTHAALRNTTFLITLHSHTAQSFCRPPLPTVRLISFLRPLYHRHLLLPPYPSPHCPSWWYLFLCLYLTRLFGNSQLKTLFDNRRRSKMFGLAERSRWLGEPAMAELMICAFHRTIFGGLNWKDRTGEGLW